MQLIDDVEEIAPKEGTEILWNEKDDVLLKTLYVERECPLNVNVGRKGALLTLPFYMGFLLTEL